MAKKAIRKKVNLRKEDSRSKNPEPNQEKVHPWRLCPSGEHWVRAHPLHMPPSGRHPSGLLTSREGHCARNPSRKDQLYPHEILEISDQNFSKVKNKPCSIDLGFKGKGDKYDELIAGWVQYWNDIFKSKNPLDPNLVKALIATESSFRKDLLANKKNQNSARGLMQVTNGSRKILGDEKGELKEHFLTVTRAELNDPNINICAGVRWLFHKRKLVSSRLNREATWEEVIYSYKGCSTVEPSRAKDLIDEFSKKLQELQKCGRK